MAAGRLFYWHANCKGMKFQDGGTVTPFELKGGGMLYVMRGRIVVETEGGSLEIPLDGVRSCSSRGRRLDVVWDERGPVHVMLHLARLPAAAAETAIFERMYADDAP